MLYYQTGVATAAQRELRGIPLTRATRCTSRISTPSKHNQEATEFLGSRLKKKRKDEDVDCFDFDGFGEEQQAQKWLW